MKKNIIIGIITIFMLILDAISPISSLVFAQDNANKEIENIFTLDFLKVDGNEVLENEIIEIGAGTQVSLRYNWVMINHNAVAGDYSRIIVPEAFAALSNYSGDLMVTVDDVQVHVGFYTLNKDTNLLEFVFNENIEELDVEAGFVEFQFDFNLEYFSENVRQTISFNDSVDKEINVVVQPSNTSKTIDKVGLPDSYLDANKIVWSIDVYNNSQLARNGFIRDTFEPGLNLDMNSFILIPFTIGFDGSMHVLSDQQQSLASDTIVVENSVFTVTIPEIQAYSGYRLVYDTTFNDFESLVFENTAEYVFGEVPALIATATVSGLTRSNVVEKRAIEIDEHEIQWIIDINKSNMNLTNASVIDTMDEMLSILSDTVTVVELNLIQGVWQPGNSYDAASWSYLIDSQNVSFNLGNIGEQAYRISYNTKIEYTGNYVAVNEFENNATLKNEELPIGGDLDRVSITRSPVLSKTSTSNVTFDNKTLTWTITVNEAKHPLGNVVVSDTLPSGLDLDENSIVIKNEAGNDVTGTFVSGITSSPSSFSITLGNINTETYTITYNTEITDFTINTFINSAAMTGDGIDGTITTNSSTSPASNTFSKTRQSTNYSEKTISWRLVVRPTREAIQDLTIIDTYPNKGLTLVESSVQITLAGVPLDKDIDYTISYVDGSTDFKDGFKIVFISGSYNNTVQIDYKTSFDPENGIDENITTNRVYRNKAQFVGTTVNANTFDVSREAQTTLITAAWFSGKKEGRLVHNESEVLVNGWESGFERLIRWEVYTNYLEQTLVGPVVISDTLGYVGEIDSGSVQLFEYIVNTNGSTVLSQTAIDSDLYSIVVDGDSMTITFATGYNQRVAIVFLTTVDSLSVVNYTNNASVTIGGSEPLNYAATITYQEYNDFLSKEEVFEREGSNAFVDEEIEWEITLNESLSIINNALVIDTISTGMVLIEDSVVIESIVGENTNIIDPSNYTISIINNELSATVETELRIDFNEYEITTIVRITYKTVVVTDTGVISNSAIFNGDEIVENTIESEELTARQLSFSGGIANTRLGSLLINKVDSVTNQPTNATFELYYEINGEERIVGDGEFDVNGTLRIDNLSYRTYKLREVATETGYVLLENPIEIVLDSTTVNDNREMNITVENIQTLVLVKEGKLLSNNATYSEAGQTIVYTITTTNTGEEVLNNVEIVDDMISKFEQESIVIRVFDSENNPTSSSVVNGEIVLEPGDYIVLEGDYIVTQYDINYGLVANTAYSKATYRDNQPIESDEDEVTIEGDYNPEISLEKKATIYTEQNNIKQDQSALENASEYLVYELVSKNTGNVTLHNVGITDELDGLFDIIYTHLDGNGEMINGEVVNYQVTLQPNESLVMMAKLDVTQAILDQGLIYNQASTTGNIEDKDNPDQPSEQIVEDSDDLEVVVKQSTDIQLIKEVLNGEDYSQVGEIVSYRFTITNTGVVSLYNVKLEDNMIQEYISYQINGIGVDHNEEGFTLASDDVLVVVGTYTITQEDIETGSLVNVASVTGEDGVGNLVDDEDEVIIEAVQNYVLSLTKENEIKDLQGNTINQFSDVTDQIYYTITIKNAGNMILYNVIVEDSMIDVLSDVQYVHFDGNNQVIKTYTSEDIEQIVLMPNEQLVMSAIYNVVADDLENGNIINVATATYEDENGEVLGESDDFTESYGFTRLTILKVDEKDLTKALEGAEFELTNLATQQTWTVVTDSKGMAAFNNLLFGEYELKETKSPDGYSLSTDEIIIVIDEDNNTDINLTITNKETLADMSDGSYHVSASVLMLLGLLLLLVSKKKQRV